jgi:hypothetical protein
METVRIGRTIGFDSSHYVSPDFGRWMMSHGHRFVMRYLRRSELVDEDPSETWPVSLSRSELEGLLDVGLAVGLTQFYRGSQMLTEADGYKAGAAMVANAKSLGASGGVTLFCDAEWSDSRSKEADQLGYINGWSAAVKDQGAASIGLYVGSNTGLSGEQLYKLRRYSRYWKSLSHVPTPTPRGYCLTQSWEYVIRGTRPETWALEPMSSDNKSKGQRIDLDLAAIDSKGGRIGMIGA